MSNLTRRDPLDDFFRGFLVRPVEYGGGTSEAPQMRVDVKEVGDSYQVHAELPGIDSNFQPYFRDVADHVLRALEQIDALREMLGFAFEAGLLMESSRQGAIGRRLTGWAAILAVPTAIAGIYGMNFKNMPELEWQYGYFAAIGYEYLIEHRWPHRGMFPCLRSGPLARLLSSICRVRMRCTLVSRGKMTSSI